MIFWIGALAFAFSAYLHTGSWFSFLPDVFRDPPIRGAPEVEGACALLLGAAAVLTALPRRGAWRTAFVALAFSAVADGLGMILIALGAGPDSPFNFWFHRIGITILVIVLGSLFTRPVRNALRKGETATVSPAK
jgi:hypothetical protein